MIPLIYSLTLRVSIIVVVTGIVLFYVLSSRHTVMTWKLTFLIILVTLVPLLINIWYDLWRYGILNVH